MSIPFCSLKIPTFTSQHKQVNNLPVEQPCHSRQTVNVHARVVEAVAETKLEGGLWSTPGCGTRGVLVLQGGVLDQEVWVVPDMPACGP